MKKIKSFILNNYLKLVFLVSVIAFIFLVKDVLENKIMVMDVKFYEFIRNNLMSNPMTTFMKIITNFGSAITLVAISIIMIFIIKNKKIGITAAINLCIIAILNFALKNVFQRPRPIEYRLIDESGYSFPSGHSMIGMAFYGYLIYLIYKNVNNKLVKYASIVTLLLIAILIGISRIYLGVHYTSDVVAGFLFSLAYLIIFIRIVRQKIKIGN